MEPAIIYSAPGCWGCRMTKDQLDKNGIPYTERDVSSDETARARVKELGYSSLPVVEAAGRDWYGHRPDIIREIAPQFK